MCGDLTFAPNVQFQSWLCWGKYFSVDLVRTMKVVILVFKKLFVTCEGFSQQNYFVFLVGRLWRNLMFLREDVWSRLFHTKSQREDNRITKDKTLFKRSSRKPQIIADAAWHLNLYDFCWLKTFNWTFQCHLKSYKFTVIIVTQAL